MKTLVLLLLLAMTFGFGYRNGANHNLPDLDTLLGVAATPPPQVVPQVAPKIAGATPTPLPWMSDPHRQTTLDKPAHSQTGGTVIGGWATFYSHP